MSVPSFRIAKALCFSVASVFSFPMQQTQAFFFTGQATEWTQLLNNAQLVNLTGLSAEQLQGQIVQIGQLSEQIQNQLRIYENMRQNTLRLPDHVWGQVEADLIELQKLVAQGEGIAFSMGKLENVLNERFASFSALETGLSQGQSFASSYRSWSETNRDTFSAALRAAGLTSEQFDSEGATLSQLRALSETASGQMQALQVGHDIAVQQVAQSQKLRGLVSQQVAMMATWYQSEQAARDLAQVRREKFFNATLPTATNGQEMEPRW